jgi:Cdc6-like AAA superfamily ATPase
MSNLLLDSPKITTLSIRIEESTRASEDTIPRFVEPASGTLERAKSRRHHMVFGRRGSGKTSLLKKAASDLTLSRRPIAYVDLESFKGHPYPDVLLSVLIKTFSEFAKWLETAAVHPQTKKSFWKPFGSEPSRPPFNKEKAQKLADELKGQVSGLSSLLYAPDDVEIIQRVRSGEENLKEKAVKGGLQIQVVSASGQASNKTTNSQGQEIEAKYVDSKTDYLRRHIMDYQNIFKEIANLSGDDSYLFLDDLYHIPRSDQAKVVDYFHSIGKGNNLWLKVGTIRHRTDWYIHGNPPVGVKLGDDADEIDLDLSLEKYPLAKDFLNKILNRFFDESEILPKDVLVEESIDRLVLASGGVARDFLGIFRRSIDFARTHDTKHRGHKIGIEDVNHAAGDYDSSKREELRRDTLDDNSVLETEFRKVRDFCVKYAKANVFLVDKDENKERYELIQELMDLRLIHKVSSRVTVSKRPGRIFEAYMLDLSQYTGSRKMREMRIVEFWRQGRADQLRLVSMVYDPDAHILEEDVDSEVIDKPDNQKKKKGWVQDHMI